MPYFPTDALISSHVNKRIRGTLSAQPWNGTWSEAVYWAPFPMKARAALLCVGGQRHLDFKENAFSMGELHELRL